MKVGEKIRKRRLELDMTMEDLGRSIGVQRSAINKYEKGLIDIKASTLSAIAQALNVSPVDLLDDIETPTEEQTKEEKIRVLTRNMHSLDMDQIDQMTNMFKIMFEKTNPELFREGNDEQ